MSTETIATVADRTGHALRDTADRAKRESRAIDANAAKVLDTTRRAWGDIARTAKESAETSETTGTRRSPRASQPKKTRRAAPFPLAESRCRAELLESETAVNAADLMPDQAVAAPDLDAASSTRAVFRSCACAAALSSRYAFAWCAQMRRLVALATPFVVVAECAGDETADDQRLRAAWLRTHRAQLTAYCRGVIVIEPRIEARATTPRSAARDDRRQRRAHAVVVSSMRVAGELVPVLLKHSVPQVEPLVAGRTQAL